MKIDRVAISRILACANAVIFYYCLWTIAPAEMKRLSSEPIFVAIVMAQLLSFFIWRKNIGVSTAHFFVLCSFALISIAAPPGLFLRKNAISPIFGLVNIVNILITTVAVLLWAINRADNSKPAGKSEGS